MTYISLLSDLALYFEDYLMCKRNILGVICQYDLMLDFKMQVGHCDLYFMVH